MECLQEDLQCAEHIVEWHKNRSFIAAESLEQYHRL